jgi:hypothetical protein
VFRPSPADVARALSAARGGVERYKHLQSRLIEVDVSKDPDFQRAFTTLYKVRRDTAWRRVFFSLLENEKRAPRGFEAALRSLHSKTRRYEASFASKLVATVNPSLPVLDLHVLRNLDVTLPRWGSKQRLSRILDAYALVMRRSAELLRSGTGKRLLSAFDKEFPGMPFTAEKKLDLVLWKLRP